MSSNDIDRLLVRLRKIAENPEQRKKLNAYVSRLESRREVGEPREEDDREYGGCRTLYQYRKQLGLSQSQLAMACSVFALLSEQGYDRQSIALQLRQLRGERNRVSCQHISWFEIGSRRPWARIRQILAETIGLLIDRPISPEDLFPEVDFSDGEKFWIDRAKASYSRVPVASLESIRAEFEALQPRHRSPEEEFQLSDEQFEALRSLANFT